MSADSPMDSEEMNKRIQLLIKSGTILRPKPFDKKSLVPEKTGVR